MSRAATVRLFLDANVLISVAWKEQSKVARLWSIPQADLVSSNFVYAECARNLKLPEQHRRLARYLEQVRVFDFPAEPALEQMPEMEAKDRHVLAAAVLTRSHFLVTGDRAHFGQWYGTSVLGVRVEPPSRFPLVLTLC